VDFSAAEPVLLVFIGFFAEIVGREKSLNGERKRHATIAHQFFPFWPGIEAILVSLRRYKWLYQ
jgi:hypothetical protein